MMSHSEASARAVMVCARPHGSSSYRIGSTAKKAILCLVPFNLPLRLTHAAVLAEVHVLLHLGVVVLKVLAVAVWAQEAQELVLGLLRQQVNRAVVIEAKSIRVERGVGHASRGFHLQTGGGVEEALDMVAVHFWRLAGRRSECGRHTRVGILRPGVR